MKVMELKKMGIFGSDEEKYYDKAHGYFDKGDFEKAIEYLDKLLEINPSSIDALSNKGITLNNMGRFDEALSYYNKVLEIEPNNTITLINKAYILMHDIKDYEEAVKYYNILLKMDKKVFKEKIEYSNFKYPDILLHIWNNKGIALFNLGKYEEAISCYNETLKIDPGNLKALNSKKLAGNKLNNIQSNPGSDYAQIDNRMNFCPKCGTKSIAGAEFCYKCGTRLIRTDVVGDISTSVNGSGNENINYQNTEEPLAKKKNKSQKKFKHSVISILDAVPKFSLIFFYVSIISLFISFIMAFIDLQFFYIIIPIVVCALFLSLVLLFIVYFSLEVLDKSY